MTVMRRFIRRLLTSRSSLGCAGGVLFASCWILPPVVCSLQGPQARVTVSLCKDAIKELLCFNLLLILSISLESADFLGVACPRC